MNKQYLHERPLPTNVTVTMEDIEARAASRHARSLAGAEQHRKRRQVLGAVVVAGALALVGGASNELWPHRESVIEHTTPGRSTVGEVVQSVEPGAKPSTVNAETTRIIKEETGTDTPPSSEYFEVRFLSSDS